MTTIAYKDGVMAADTAVFNCAGLFCGSTTKIIKVGKTLAGAAGSLDDVTLFLRWIKDGSQTDQIPKFNDRISCLYVRAGILWRMSKSGVPYLFNEDWAAIGSGDELAIGALANGATPFQAIKIACKYDDGSQEPIDVLKLE